MAPRVLAALPLAGRLVTGDALYCQRELCAQIREAGGDYLLIVKANQRRLYEDIELLFAEPPEGEVFREAEQRDRHGDRHEVRRLWASTALRGYLDWPGVQQVCKPAAGGEADHISTTRIWIGRAFSRCARWSGWWSERGR